MILEALQYLTTPCPRHLRSLGYLKELIATEARYRRCRAAWQPHLDKTRAMISAAAGAASGNEKAVVLGGGLLTDIPLRVLAAKFATVVLVDVCFLKQTRRNVWRHPHIEMQTCDITGVAEAVRRGEIPDRVVPDMLSLEDADLVVSANVMSQLPLVPLAYLRKRHGLTDAETARTFAEGIFRAHLELLKACRGTVCLITEVERQFLDGGVVLGSEDPLCGVEPDKKGAEEWFWDIAPRPEASPDYDIRNRVRGVVW
ncbi:hypothetical protein L2D14_08320 [Thalassospiraceae bacterium LMO-JJ14]|nr:hypothetical protein L2D14_08320 [Thalassospiraceae bacterium LMO-JJ14]